MNKDFNNWPIAIDNGPNPIKNTDGRHNDKAPLSDTAKLLIIGSAIVAIMYLGALYVI